MGDAAELPFYQFAFGEGEAEVDLGTLAADTLGHIGFGDDAANAGRKPFHHRRRQIGRRDETEPEIHLKPRHAGLRKRLFCLGNRMRPEMEDRRGEDGAGSTLRHALHQMLESADAARSDDRD